MTDSLRIGKRALTVAVAAMTILWSVGISAFVAPMTARAASAGDLIKGTTLSTLYYLASDGSRYAFPNEKTYMTWYSDFSGVQSLSDSALAAIPLAGNVVYRPGSRWIKIQSDPKTYAVSPQGQIRWIESEAVAVGLAGANWNTFIDDVADVFFVDYSVGASLASASNGYNGLVLSSGGNNYLVWNAQKRMVSSAGFSGNRMQSRFVLSGTGVNLAGIAAGSDLTGAEAALIDAAQLGGGVTGGLSVSLASDTPASATVPAGADSVSFSKFKLMANAGSATINQIVLTLGGVGDVGNIDNVYLYKGDTRLTDARSVNSSTRKVTFSGLSLALAAGDMVYLTARADTSDAVDGGDTASFGIAASGDVSGTATVSGNFPVYGNNMSFSTTAAGDIVVDKNGTVSNPTIGQDGATIAKLSIEANGEDASLKQLTLNVDTAADHSNYKLWKGSTLLGNGTVSGDLVTFILTNPLLVEDGDSENLEVTADIGGEADDDVKVSVEEEADVLAIGGDFGFNLSVDITGYDESGSLCAGTGDDCSFSTIEGGQLTFAFNGPSSDDIQIDGKDQVLMKFSITAEEMTEIQEFDVIVACDAASASACDTTADAGDLLNSGNDEANLEDITIRTTSGSAWMGPEELDVTNSDAVSADDQTQTLTYSDDQTLNGGQTIDLMITADVNSAAIDLDIYNVTIDMSTVQAEDANGDDLAAADIVPSSDITGNLFTVTDASLDITVSEPPSDGTFVKGVQNTAVVGYAFEAGDASDISVTDLTVSATGDDDSTFTGGTSEDNVDVGDNVSSCSLYDSESGALVDGPESPDANDQLLFENFDWTVAGGETGKLILKCNFANTDTSGGNGDAYAFFLASDADVEAEDDDGDSLTAAQIGLTALTVADVSSVPEIDIIDAGDITVTLDGGTANSTIVLGSSTGVSVAKYKFDATDEAFTVKKLTLRNCVIPTGTADADDDCADGGETAGADDIAATVKISYLNQAGSTVTKSGFLSGNSVTFSSLEFYVPVDATRTLTVTIDTGVVSSTGATSGNQMSLNFDAETTGAVATFEAVGSGSGETLTEADVDTYVVANEMTVRKTKPTISLASGSPSGAGVQGLAEVLRFNVAADSRGSVTLDAVAFLVSTFDSGAAWADCDDAIFGAATGWEFYDLDDPSTKLDDATDWTFLDAAGNNCTAGEPLKVLELDLEGSGTTPAEEIGAGETKTYVLKADTTGAVADDSVRVDIADEVTIDAYAFALVPSAIRWDDDTEADDINGSLVKNLPVTGGSIVY